MLGVSSERLAWHGRPIRPVRCIPSPGPLVSHQRLGPHDPPAAGRFLLPPVQSARLPQHPFCHQGLEAGSHRPQPGELVQAMTCLWEGVQMWLGCQSLMSAAGQQLPCQSSLLNGYPPTLELTNPDLHSPIGCRVWPAHRGDHGRPCPDQPLRLRWHLRDRWVVRVCVRMRGKILSGWGVWKPAIESLNRKILRCIIQHPVGLSIGVAGDVDGCKAAPSRLHQSLTLRTCSHSSSPEPICRPSRRRSSADCVRQGWPDPRLPGHSRHCEFPAGSANGCWEMTAAVSEAKVIGAGRHLSNMASGAPASRPWRAQGPC